MSGLENLKELMVELQSNGIRVSSATGLARQGGAGPANGRTLVFGEHQITVPTSGHCAANSQYILDETGDGPVIKNGNNAFCGVEFPQNPGYYSLNTSEGVPYWKIALLHGRDCLASTVIQTCFRWNTAEQCKFCGIGISLQNDTTIPIKTPAQLAEVAAAALRLDGIKHVTLTAGTIKNHAGGIKYLGKCAQAIKEATGLPIHVQFEPTEDLRLLQELKAAGVDTVGIHIESFDQRVREEITPGKAKTSVQQYFQSFAKAVEVFGRNQVSTYIIIGLGEDRQVTVEGCKQCIALGVYPFVVPLRPVKGTQFENLTPPESKTMKDIYEVVAQALAENELSWKKTKAGCVRCGACSALPAYER